METVSKLEVDFRDDHGAGSNFCEFSLAMGDDVKGGTRGEQVATSFHVFVQSFVVFFASTHIHTKYE